MRPRESALLVAAATLLGHNRDTAYGPAHAVRDVLALEEEFSRQSRAVEPAFSSLADLERRASERKGPGLMEPATAQALGLL